MLARGRFLSPAVGKHVATGLVFVAWHVFQEYVGKLVREATAKAKLDLKLRVQGSVLIAQPVSAGRPLFAQPDFHIEYHSRVVATGDAKYMRTLDSGEVLDAASVAQVLTAARACDAENAIIFRPHRLEASPPPQPVEWKPINAGNPGRLLLYLVRPAAICDPESHEREVKRMGHFLASLVPTRSLTATV